MPPAENRAERAERILDAAAELLLRAGYRRTTVEDVAERAGVGKGTVYLHWKNREELFLAVLLRESARSLEDLVTALEADPLAVGLARLTGIQYANVLGRPLLRAGYADDAGTLGKLLPKLHTKLDPRHQQAFVDYLELLAANDLLRADRPARELAVAYQAVLHGFLRAAHPPELIADTVAHAFEPVALSTRQLRAVAPRVLELFTESVALDRKQIERAY
ncbi:TetR/AcrR family transcriptional regulator [Amycolatopsis sp. SID8362]|uniref:TetR/AcrR family transcriptional regulator n=1 Tax=Amycolatopsis sp. SID8362 TaxID=2690346 RepID=UPI00137227D2|nr:TetR/AcrR family transcriptional regulator [Amycolatopsis sp. SID8362]NBH06717.1 TetR family transcriptional regulator [Amycolatopsis sp. SID8362]NED43414.1 TetR/AcrR family transcriptional regulator [Amycolatopsis sp. SID8362]